MMGYRADDMVVIPAARDTDVEDVTWALQTAEALWRRNERVDAIVWLRRAAQAAGEANDDDRALFLARHAAELSEWLAHNQGEAPPIPSDAPTAVTEASKSSLGPLDDLLANLPSSSVPAAGALPSFAIESEQPPPVARSPVPAFPSDPPTAEQAHAGLLDPWSEAPKEAAPARARRAPSPAAPPPKIDVPAPTERFEEEEVVTSANFVAATPSTEDVALEGMNMAAALKAVRDSQRAPHLPQPEGDDDVTAKPPPVAPSIPKAPPVPTRAKPPLPKPPLPRAPLPKPPVPSAAKPPLPKPAPPKPAAAAAAPPEAAPPPEPAPPPPAPHVEAPPPPMEVEPPTPIAPRVASVAPQPRTSPIADGVLSLDDVEAFADLPDDARVEFASAATIATLGKDEEVSGFALAFVIDGEVDVAATIVDAPADRLRAGAVLRTRGTVGDGMELRLIGTDQNARVATWAPEAVEAAFKTCPWVEDDLRTAADRMQALVGITMGQIADRLDPSLRQGLTERLEVRTLAPGDTLVAKGSPVPGLVLLGVGALEIVDGGDVRGEIGPGDFLFASEVLGGGPAPAAARAGSDGAVYLFADRHVAQELLVTCPPLLEIFAGM